MRISPVILDCQSLRKSKHLFFWKLADRVHESPHKFTDKRFLDKLENSFIIHLHRECQKVCYPLSHHIFLPCDVSDLYITDRKPNRVRIPCTYRLLKSTAENMTQNFWHHFILDFCCKLWMNDEFWKSFQHPLEERLNRTSPNNSSLCKGI